MGTCFGFPHVSIPWFVCASFSATKAKNPFISAVVTNFCVVTTEWNLSLCSRYPAYNLNCLRILGTYSLIIWPHFIFFFCIVLGKFAAWCDCPRTFSCPACLQAASLFQLVCIPQVSSERAEGTKVFAINQTRRNKNVVLQVFIAVLSLPMQSCNKKEAQENINIVRLSRREILWPLESEDCTEHL